MQGQAGGAARAMREDTREKRTAMSQQLVRIVRGAAVALALLGVAAPSLGQNAPAAAAPQPIPRGGVRVPGNARPLPAPPPLPNAAAAAQPTGAPPTGMPMM